MLPIRPTLKPKTEAFSKVKEPKRNKVKSGKLLKQKLVKGFHFVVPLLGRNQSIASSWGGNCFFPPSDSRTRLWDKGTRIGETKAATGSASSWPELARFPFLGPLVCQIVMFFIYSWKLFWETVGEFQQLWQNVLRARNTELNQLFGNDC